MTDFVRSPNLPKKVETLIIGSKYRGVLEASLTNLGIDVIWIDENPDVDPRLASHCDLSVLHTGGNSFILAPYLSDSFFTKKMKKAGANITFAGIRQKSEYPHDAQLNQCIFGEYRIFNPKSAFEFNSKNLINVTCTQGYARCSVCIVSERAIITADRIIAERAGEKGIDVLLISPGGISLDGFPYGFIGGAAFKLSENTLAFTGHLKNHADRDRIEKFLNLHEVEIEYLTEYPAFDIGGAIPLSEKISY